MSNEERNKEVKTWRFCWKILLLLIWRITSEVCLLRVKKKGLIFSCQSIVLWAWMGLIFIAAWRYWWDKQLHFVLFVSRTCESLSVRSILWIRQTGFCLPFILQAFPSAHSLKRAWAWNRKIYSNGKKISYVLFRTEKVEYLWGQIFRKNYHTIWLQIDYYSLLKFRIFRWMVVSTSVSITV